MPFVQAKCPECGGMLAVDDSKKAAVCQFCSEAFIVQDAINNYNTYNITNNNTTHNYGDGAVVNIYEDKSKDFVIEAGVLKEYHGAEVDVVVPDSVQKIDEYCFEDLLIESITLTSDIEESSLCDALKNCKVLKDDGEQIKSIKTLKRILITDNVQKLTKVDDIIFNQNKTIIIWLPENKSNQTFTIPSSINTLSNIARENLWSYKELFYKDYNLRAIPCNKNELIDFFKKANFPFKSAHEYVDGKCKVCGEYEWPRYGYELINFKYGTENGYVKTYFYSPTKVGISIEKGVFITTDFTKTKKSVLEKCLNVKTLILFHLNDPKSSFRYGYYNKKCCPSTKQLAGYASLFNLFQNVEELVIEEDTGYYDDVEEQYYSILEQLIKLIKVNKISCGNERIREKVCAIQEKMRIEKQEWERLKRRSAGLCQHCGGTFKGLLNLKCSKCGMSKDY